MATSGSADFSVTRKEILEDAASELGVLALGQTLSANQITQGSRFLNMIVKQWQGKSDFAPGLKVWTRKRATIFLEKNKASYTLGPGGDHATNSFTETTLSADAAASATSLTVSSITGISDADNIGIILNDGNVHWTTVNGAPSGSTVVITTGLPSAADSGKTIWAYTTKITRPLTILNINTRDSNGNDSPMFPMTLDDYEAIADKGAAGDATRYYYEQDRLTGELYLDYAIDDVTNTLKMTYLRPIEDFDSATDEPDYPQEWFRPLVYQLAMDWAGSFGVGITVDLKLKRDESLMLAQNVNPENADVFFEPDRYE